MADFLGDLHDDSLGQEQSQQAITYASNAAQNPTAPEPIIKQSVASNNYQSGTAPRPDMDNDLRLALDKMQVNDNEAQPEQEGKGWLHAFAEVLEGPIHGPIEAANETLATGQYIASLGQMDPYKHIIPNLHDPTSLGGKISSGLFQFLAGFTALGAVGRAAGIGTLASSSFGSTLMRGAITDATVFDGHQENLANLFQSVTGSQDPISQYLKSDPNDSQAWGKLKNALTGVVGTALLEPVAQAIKGSATFMRDFKARQQEVGAQQTATQEAVSHLNNMSQQEQMLALRGDPSKPGFQFLSAEDTTKQAEDAAARKKEVAPAPGYSYNQASPEHLAEGAEAPQVIQQVKIDPLLDATRPRYKGDDGKSYAVSFPTSEDKLAYLATNPKSPSNTRAMEQLKDAGWSEDQVSKIGDALREDLAQKSRAVTDPNTRTLPAVVAARNQFVNDATKSLGGAPLDISANAMVNVRYNNGAQGGFNFSAMDSPAAIKSTIAQMRDAYEKNPDVRTWAKANVQSENLDALDNVLNAPKDRLPQDAEVLASKQLLAASIQKTYGLADKLVTAGAQGQSTDTLRYAFAQQLETHRLISNYWNWQGTELGRALNIRKAVIDPTSDLVQSRMKEIQRALGTLDGQNSLEDLANQVKKAVDGDDGIDGKVAKLKLLGQNSDNWWQKSVRSVQETWVNGLLSSAKSTFQHGVNPGIIMSSQILERGMMEGIASLTGDTSAIVPGETVQWLLGMKDAVTDALRYGKDAFLYGGKGRAWGQDYARTSTDIAAGVGRMRALSSDYWDAKNADGTTSAIGRAIDMLGMVINGPARMHLAPDEFWSTLYYRGELRAGAFNQATNEMRGGTLQPEAFQQRVKDIIADPSNELQERGIQNAHYNTLQSDPGKIGRVFQQVKDISIMGAPVGWLLMPFTTIPANVLNYAIARTPLPLVFQNTVSDILRGGEVGQKALARAMSGSMVLGVGMDAYQRGYLTGKGSLDPNERAAMERQGIQPYSVRIGDTYYKYERLDYLGHMFAMVGDMGDALSYLHTNDREQAKDFGLVATEMGLGLAESTMAKAYFQGMQGFMDAMNDPQHKGEAFLRQYLSTFVPFSGALNSAHQLTRDEYLAPARTSLDMLTSKIPGLGAGMPPRLDLWGRPMTVSRGTSQTWNALMPIEASVHNPEPIDQEMVKQKMFFAMPSQKFKTADGKDVDLTNNAQAYARYVQLAGNEPINPAYGMGAKDLLNSIVTGNHSLSSVYEGLQGGDKDSEKKKFIQQILTDYRAYAKQQLLEDYPDVAKESRVNSENNAVGIQ